MSSRSSAGSNESEVAKLEAEYLEAKVAAAKMARQGSMKTWHSTIAKYAAKVRQGQPKDYWRWIKWLIGRGRSESQKTVQPVFDPSLKKVVYDPEEIGRAWAGHYSRLAADTGHSRNPSHWEQFDRERPEMSELPGINQVPTWEEVRGALKKSCCGKAAGRDGVPIELYKAELVAEREEENVPTTTAEVLEGEDGEEHPSDTHKEPCSKLGKVLYLLLVSCWERDRVPECWDTANVVSIPKKGGDPLSMDSCRGISLINVALKLLSTVVARRISNALESHKRLCREQGGFRDAEECVAQVAALYEVLRRRQIVGKILCGLH